MNDGGGDGLWSREEHEDYTRRRRFWHDQTTKKKESTSTG